MEELTLDGNSNTLNEWLELLEAMTAITVFTNNQSLPTTEEERKKSLDESTPADTMRYAVEFFERFDVVLNAFSKCSSRVL